MATVEQLYKNFGVLADAKDKAGEHVKEYASILSAVKGGPNEKRLASQFIARFFRHFPDLAEQALNAQFDLCEDEDLHIRKQAMKDLPQLCKGCPDHVPRIANILTQLLQSDDPGEVSLIQSGLLSLFRIDAKGTLQGLFSQILQDDIVDVARERAIQFMATKMKTLPEELWTKTVEEYLIAECRKVLQDVTGDEFQLLMRVLSGLTTMSTLQGRKQLVEIVCEQADLDTSFDASDSDSIERLLQCGKEAIPLFSKNVHSTKFLKYLCANVVPTLGQMGSPTAGEDNGSGEGDASSGEAAKMSIQLDVLKLFAEMSTFSGELDKPEQDTQVVFDTLLEYMPLPPPANDENASATNGDQPKLQFSHVECLMYAFHQMARRCPQLLTDTEHADRLKDFRVRLQYFARGVQVYIKQLKMSLQGKTGADLKTDENKIKVAALKITSNINTLIKDLFHNPPSYKAVVTLSWRPTLSAKSAQPVAPIVGQKRPGITPITFESDNSSSAKKVSKNDRQVYSPPGGKYSERAGTFPAGARGGRGGQQGRGRGRGYRRW